MLPRSKRVTKDIFSALSRGRLIHSRLLSLRFVKGDGESRFSFVTPKKVAPKAVDRNLLKRRGTAVLQDIYPVLIAPITGVFFFKKGALEVSAEELRDEIEELLENTGGFK